MNIQVHILKRNCYGITYSIPENLVSRFNALDENIQNSQEDFDAEMNALDEFGEEFSRYEYNP